MSRVAVRTRVRRRLGARRRGWRTVRAGVGRGLRLRLDRASADYTSGTNELPVQVALRDSLRSGATFVDVGANVGFFSLVAARLVGRSGRVYAFEPVAANAASLRTNAARNRATNVDVVVAALGRRDGVATLAVTEHPGGATLAADSAVDAYGTVEVPVVTLDGLVASGRLHPPSVVKIDVEGTELDVLEGMVDTLAHVHPVVICEVDASTEAAADIKRDAVSGFLRAVGYDVHELERSYADGPWYVRHVVAAPRADRPG